METHRLALPKGFRLANYELTRVLGKGGFGITYLGIDRHLGRKVAVKELMPDTIVTRVEGMVVAQSEALTENWSWAKERFLEEARVLAGFKHPNIVEVHQLIEANGTVYMVMDYVEGESYEARLRRIAHEPDEQSMSLLLEPLLDGLEEVHAAGLLHRDIKPDNIILRRGLQPILLDFGSARKQLEGTAVMTSLVTHGYSPIEQYQIKGKQGPWTDIYALGAVAVRAITGEKPPMSADRVSEDEFVWLSYRGLKGFSPLFLQAIDWALRTKPKDRPQAVSEWRASFGWGTKTTSHGKHTSAKAVIDGEKTSLAVPLESKTAPRKFERAPRIVQLPAPKPPLIAPLTTETQEGAWKLPVAATFLLLFGMIFGGWLISHKAASTSNATSSSLLEPVTPPTPTPNLPRRVANHATFVNSLGMKFAPIPDTDLLFSVWDTRVSDYSEFVKATGRAWKKPDFTQDPDHPAVNVSWDDAKAFCEWLSAKEGRTYRLPTDAEWSLAAGLQGEKGATPRDKDGKITAVYSWDGNWPPPRGAGNYARSLMADDYEKTSPVGSFAENRFGLFDMSGNVWQWCADWYDGSQRKRVLRGGAWNSCLPEMLLSSFRYYSVPTDQCDNVGFRCVTPAASRQPQSLAFLAEQRGPPPNMV